MSDMCALAWRHHERITDRRQSSSQVFDEGSYDDRHEQQR